MRQMWLGLVRPAGGETEQEQLERSWTRYGQRLSQDGSPHRSSWSSKARLEEASSWVSWTASRFSTLLEAVTTRSLRSWRTPLIKRSNSSQRIVSCGGGLRPSEPTWLDLDGCWSSSSTEMNVQRGTEHALGCPLHSRPVGEYDATDTPRRTAEGCETNRPEKSGRYSARRRSDQGVNELGAVGRH